MTFYLTPYGRRAMRHAVNNLRELDQDWSNSLPEVIFPVDVRAEDDAFVLTALLPGLCAEDLNIQVVNENISLQGEFKNERDDSSNYLLKEVPSGRFSRTITLPERVDASKADASLENGVLVLRVPKAEELRPKTIKIQTK